MGSPSRWKMTAPQAADRVELRPSDPLCGQDRRAGLERAMLSPTRQIFSMLVPPGAPIGSPQVIA